ncbi:MAG: hypothetical protein ACE14T_10160 [Syntrophales bacterium]
MNWPTKTQKKTGAKDYSEEWKSALYWDDNLGIYEPASHIEGALIKAAVNFQITGKGKKTYKDLFKSSVFVTPDYIPHGLNGSPEKLLSSGKLSVDKRLVRVANSGVERMRPMLKSWSLEFVVEVHDSQISREVVKEVLDLAGQQYGIGDFRPRYGRFMVARFE